MSALPLDILSNANVPGRCERAEKAFKETATKFAVLPNTPNMALVNCDDQPILCNAWAATPSWLWSIQMLSDPAATDIYKKRLNTTTVTSGELVELKSKPKTDEAWQLLESRFHPFHGQLTDLGVTVPIGYVLWAFSILPSWALMLVISMVSRSMMYVDIPFPTLSC